MPNNTQDSTILFIDLIDENCDINALFAKYQHTFDRVGHTLLDAASQKNLPKVIEQLIIAGFDVNSKNKDKNCALYTALFHKSTDAALTLINQGIDRNSICHNDSIEHTILGFAIHAKQNLVVCALINTPINTPINTQKVDLNGPDGEGLRPLNVAIKHENMRAILMLKDAGADFRLKTESKYGTTPISLLQQAVNDDNIIAVKYLLGLGLNLKIDKGVWDIFFRDRNRQRPVELLWVLLLGLLKQDPARFIKELQSIPRLADRIHRDNNADDLDLSQFITTMNDYESHSLSIFETGRQAQALVNYYTNSTKRSINMAICASVALFILLIGLSLIFFGPAALTITAIAVTAVAGCATGASAGISLYSLFQTKQVDNALANIESNHQEEPQELNSIENKN